MSTEQKVAVIRRAPSLGEHHFYAITYTRDGDVTGKSIARADEIDAWRKDLIETGWTLAEHSDSEPEPAPEPEPDPFGGLDPVALAKRIVIAETEDIDFLGIGEQIEGWHPDEVAAMGEEAFDKLHRRVDDLAGKAVVTVEIPDEATP